MTDARDRTPTVEEMYEQNRRSWNAITPVHNSHKRDQAAFFRAGGTTLWAEELALLGDDVAGRRLVHLQCNCGQDSLSLAQLGADVTGVDISDAAVEFARGLAADTEIAARFVRAELLTWMDAHPSSGDPGFDIAFCSYGAIGWLSDLARWARGVAGVLRPGGRLVMVEFHPLAWSFGPGGALSGDPYFAADPLRSENGVNDYVGEALAVSGYEPGMGEFENPEPTYSFQWTVADIVQVLIDAGLAIEQLREYPHSNGCEIFDGMRPIEGRRFTMPEGLPAMPLMLGVVARRR